MCSIWSVKKTRKKKRELIFDEEGLRKLADQLKVVRKRMGFTQEKLAYESDLALSQIARIETMRTNPTVSTMFKIARTLGVPVSDLFEFKLKKK